MYDIQYTRSTHLYGEAIHGTADSPLEQAAAHHDRAGVIAELFLQLVVLQLARHHARSHLEHKRKPAGKRNVREGKGTSTHPSPCTLSCMW